MGYKNYSAGTMTLTFSMPGEYTFDDLYLVCQPMESVEKQTEKLGKESLENVSMETNKIIGDIEVSSDKFLAFSIPYSAGFRAYVDGKKVDLIKANSMYMGIELKRENMRLYLLTVLHILYPGIDTDSNRGCFCFC